MQTKAHFPACICLTLTSIGVNDYFMCHQLVRGLKVMVSNATNEEHILVEIFWEQQPQLLPEDCLEECKSTNTLPTNTTPKAKDSEVEDWLPEKRLLLQMKDLEQGPDFV